MDLFVEVSMKEFNRMYERLNVQFDHTLGESFYNDKMGAIVEELKAKELLEESEGALVVRLEEENMPPCLIIKTDGTTIYPTRDLATAVYRHDVMKADKMLYVVGGEQKLHFRQVFAVLSRMGYAWSEICEHIPFGLMRFEGRKMSTRRGKLSFCRRYWMRRLLGHYRSFRRKIRICRIRRRLRKRLVWVRLYSVICATTG